MTTLQNFLEVLVLSENSTEKVVLKVRLCLRFVKKVYRDYQLSFLN